MFHISSSSHIYPLGDGKFRLTFISASPGGASFLCELGDFSELEVINWLHDHLHPETDFSPIRSSLSSGTAFTLPLGHMVMTCHLEDGELVKSPATEETVCQWLSEFQRHYFCDAVITAVVCLVKQREMKATACFCRSYPKMGIIMASAELVQFESALKISLLHELIHANLYAEGDPDEKHGERSLTANRPGEIPHLLSVVACSFRG